MSYACVGGSDTDRWTFPDLRSRIGLGDVGDSDAAEGAVLNGF